jgi:hypothetical protein
MVGFAASSRTVGSNRYTGHNVLAPRPQVLGLSSPPVHKGEDNGMHPQTPMHAVRQGLSIPERLTPAALAGRGLDQQIALIDRFQPTDLAQLTALPLDPAGLLARTLPLKPGWPTTTSNITYDQAGVLQLEDNPIQAGPALAAARVDVVSVSPATVYQAVDSAHAQHLA